MNHIDNYKGVDQNGDTNACTVHALSAVTGKSFKDCQIITATYGRKFGQGMRAFHVAKMLDKKCDAIEFCFYRDERFTLAQFIKEHPKGTYYVLVEGHALAVINGDLYDHSRKLRRRVNAYYFIPKGPKKSTKKVVKKKPTPDMATRILKDLEKMTQKQVAEKYGITVGRVKGIVWRNKHH